MAAANTYKETPSSLSTTPPPPPATMSTNPSPPTQTHQPLTPSQLEARTILTHLLTRLSQPNPDADTPARYHEYSTWITTHTIPTLTTTLSSTIRPQLWTVLSSRLSLDALKHVAGDLRLEHRGAIYFNGILGVDKRLRMYIGQSQNLRQRVGQHLNFRYRRDHFCLHYWALEWSVFNVFGVCAVLPPPSSSSSSSSSTAEIAGMERPDLVMNVVEMWMCLVFRTLPTSTLEEWLPDDGLVDKGRRMAKEGVVGGLNVASPLDQGVKAKEMPFVDLSGEVDVVVRDYVKEVKRRKGDVQVVEKVKGVEREVEVEVDEEERALRKKMYAEKARRYQRRRDTDIVVPQWVFLGAVAVGVGILLLRSSGGPGGSGRLR